MAPDGSCITGSHARINEGVHGAVTHAVGNELHIVRHAGPGDPGELLRGDETYAPVVRVSDVVEGARSPGASHVGASGEHSPVDVELGATKGEKAPGPEERRAGNVLNLTLDALL